MRRVKKIEFEHLTTTNIKVVSTIEEFDATFVGEVSRTITEEHMFRKVGSKKRALEYMINLLKEEEEE
jgi:hypothetical protein